MGPSFVPAERGSTLIELMIALVILAIGLLAVNQLFPAGTRAQVRDRMLASVPRSRSAASTAPATGLPAWLRSRTGAA